MVYSIFSFAFKALASFQIKLSWGILATPLSGNLAIPLGGMMTTEYTKKFYFPLLLTGDSRVLQILLVKTFVYERKML